MSVPTEGRLLLRAGLLEGHRLALAGAGPVGRAVTARAGELGARVAVLEDGAPGIDLADEDAVATALGEVLRALGGLDTLVVDAGWLAHEARGGSGLSAVRAGLDAAWVLARQAALGHLLADPAGGALLFVAPHPGVAAHAGAARAGLENLSRTLSIEWARHAIRTVAILPGPRSTQGEVAELVAYLASPAGSYFSGCRFELDALS